MLDLQSAFDRGSRPLLSAEDFQPPLDLNDDEFAAAAGYGIRHDRGLRMTEMTLPLLTYHAMICQHRLSDSQAHNRIEYHHASDQAAGRHQRHRAILAEFEHYTDRLKEICNDTAFHRFILAVAHESLLSMHLLLRRPLHRMPASMKPPVDEYDVLCGALAVLQSTIFKTSADFQPWSWYSWPKWFALAIALAELCSFTEWSEVAWQAWEVVQDRFVHYEQIVADAKTGLLWRPIARLMEKTNAAQRRQRTRPTDSRADKWLNGTPGSGGTAVDGGAFDGSLTTLVSTDTTAIHGPQSLSHTQSNSESLENAGNVQILDEEALMWFHWDAFIDDLATQSIAQGRDLDY